MNLFIAFIVGYVLSILTISGIFLYHEWDTLAPSWELVSADSIAIAILFSMLPGIVSTLIYAVVFD